MQHLYGTIQIPESYIIDANGVLRRKIVNAIDWESPEIINFLSALAVELHLKAGRSPFDVNSLHERALLAERP